MLNIFFSQFWPMIYLKGKPPKYRVEGSQVELMDILARKLDFCYEYVFPKDMLFGELLPNGTWTGMMGQLTRREVDMSGVLFSQQEARARAVDFSEFVYINDHVLGFMRPQMEPDISGFVKPYSFLVWMLLLMAVLSVLACALLIQLYHTSVHPERYSGSDSEPPSRTRESSGKDETVEGGRARLVDATRSEETSLIWIPAFLLAESIPWQPRRDSLRVLAGLWLLMACVVGSVYRSNLKAMLILPRLHLPFNNIEELAESGISLYTGTANVISVAISEASPGSQLHRLQKQRRPDTGIADSLSRFNRGLDAAFVSRLLIYFVIHTNFAAKRECKHYIARESYFGATSLSLAFPKRSQLKEKVDPVLRNLKEFGIPDHMLKRALRNTEKCMGPKSFTRTNNDLRPLELVDFYGIFSVYAGGMFLATGIFLFELASTPRDAKSKQAQHARREY
ncbi:glutamate receptor ionotropic, kainate 5-like [Panulirus ornatus]|uniref:glutamate receptor ionotropic, kainate 5-like n=1 Tax=Panulirus ornatus TaxID=150431 RepID=UPI003A841AB0